jgi:NADPH:quinone reductase-like Zn-dependent oxidoreductase
MKAVAVETFDTAPIVRDDLAEPKPTGKSILVRVHAASVNPVDNAIAVGMLKETVEHDFPVILGRDYAGTVEHVGTEVSDYAPGDEVYGFVPVANPTVHDGSWAELITVLPPMSIAPKPSSVDFATAGAAPISAIAALIAIDALKISEGDTVLIVGATGGIGSVAVQLAAQAGATVVAPAFVEDADYLSDLGAAELPDRNADIITTVREAHPHGVDALLDLVSHAPGAFDAVLGDGARVASTNDAAGEGPGRTNVLAAPTPENLHRLAELLEAGTLKVHIDQTFDIDHAADALQTLASGRVRGKIGIRVR